MALLAPRSLNEPMGCRFSSLRKIWAGAPSTFRRSRGVRITVPAVRACAARMSCRETGSSASIYLIDLDLRLDLDGDFEGQLGHADGGAGMLAYLRTVQFQNQIGEAVDDLRLAGKAGRGVDHAEDAQPGSHTVQIAQRTLQAAQDRQGGQPCRRVCFLDRYLRLHLPERANQSAIRRLRTVPGNVDSAAAYPREREGQAHAGRHFDRRRKDQPERFQPGFNLHFSLQAREKMEGKREKKESDLLLFPLTFSLSPCLPLVIENREEEGIFPAASDPFVFAQVAFLPHADLFQDAR